MKSLVPYLTLDPVLYGLLIVAVTNANKVVYKTPMIVKTAVLVNLKVNKNI